MTPPRRRPTAGVTPDLAARRLNDKPGAPDLGAVLIRDGNGPRAFDMQLRYRGATLAELWRVLAALKAPQAEVRAREEEEPGAATVLPPPACESKRTRDPQELRAPAAGSAMPRGAI